MKTFRQTIRFLFLLCNFVLAQKNIAVIELDAIGISQSESQALTDRLRFELHRSRNFTILERALMDEILREQEFQQTGCVSNECIVEAGRLLAVENVVGGSLSKVGSTYSASIRIVSVETGEVLGAAQKDFKSSIDYLLTDGMEIVVKDLITSLGAEQLMQLTTAKMPLQHYGSIVTEIGFAFKSFERGSIHPGLGIDLGFYRKKNLYSIGIVQYWLRDDNISVANLIYRRFFPEASIPLPTLKAVQIITPFTAVDIEIVRSYYEDPEIAYKYYAAIKVSVGLISDISKKHAIDIDFALRLVTFPSENARYTGSVFRFGIVFTQFPVLW